MHAQATEGATTLVWIDSEEAIIVRWADRADRGAGPLGRAGPAAAPSGHGPVDPAMRPSTATAADAQERARREELRRFVDEVACRVPDADDVTVVGPGVLRGRLERRSCAPTTATTAASRLVHSAAAERLTEQELVARVRALAGDAPPRLGVAGRPAATRHPAGRRAGVRRNPSAARLRPGYGRFREGAERTPTNGAPGGEDRPGPTCHFGPRARPGTRSHPRGTGGATHGHVRAARRGPTSASSRAVPRRSDRSSSRTSDARAAACASTPASPAPWRSTRRP